MVYRDAASHRPAPVVSLPLRAFPACSWLRPETPSPARPVGAAYVLLMHAPEMGRISKT